MKPFIFLVFAVVFLSACKKADELRYDHQPASVYFDIYNQDKDSIVYTFAYDPGKARDTLMLPVQITGLRSENARVFTAHIEADSSSARPDVHYVPLAASYTMPAGEGKTYLPFVLLNSDPALEDQAVSVIIKLTASDDFAVEIPGMIRAKIVFSSKLEKPADWWDQWFPGYYSRVKHELFILATGKTSLTSGQQGGQDAPMNLYYVSVLTTLLNNPFSWVEKNADKGFVLEKVDDDTYYFYKDTNPNKKYLIKKNEQTDKFYFIDENGQEVV